MNSGDTKIKFSVEGISQLHQSFQSILDDSKALTEEWARQGDSIVSSLSKQIELLKQRNSFSVTTSPAPATISSTSPEGDFKAMEEFLERIDREGILIRKESLKELAELMGASPKPGSKPGTDPTGKKPENDQEEEAKAQKFLRSFALTSLLRTIQTNDPTKALLGLGTNAGTAMMQMGGATGWIGAAIAAVMSVISAQYEAVASLAPTASAAARTLGGSWTDYDRRDRYFEQFGLSRSEVLNREVELARYSGNRSGIRGLTNEALLWERTGTLSSQDINQFVRTGRGDEGFGLSGALFRLENSLRKSGISDEKIQLQISEYLKEIVSLNQVQIEQFGRTNTNFSTGLYTMLASIMPETASANPEFIGRIAGSLYQGLSRPSSNQMRALQYRAMAKANPDANWFELKMMAEDPLGLSEGLSEEEVSRRRAASKNYLTYQKQAAGDWAGFAQILMSNYGLSANVAGTLAKSDRLDFDILFDEIKKVQKRAPDSVLSQKRDQLSNSVSSIEKLIAEWEGVKLGDNVEGIRKVVEDIRKLIAGEYPGKSANRQELENTRTLVNNLQTGDSWWKRMMSGFIASGTNSFYY